MWRETLLVFFHFLSEDCSGYARKIKRTKNKSKNILSFDQVFKSEPPVHGAEIKSTEVEHFMKK
jgi:hypothetical protein